MTGQNCKESAVPHSATDFTSLGGVKVTIMGLGLHGGGLESARFFARRGASVTVTDMRDEKTLAPSIEALAGLPIRYVLGRHEMADFSGADIVVKNPAVKSDSPYLSAAHRVETDISVFLAISNSPLVAVTGSKGKSSTASAIYHGFGAAGISAFLGGNITVSPLTFVEETSADRPVVLELSSWQLADIRGLGVLKPKVALLTSIMPDHMNRYSSMDEYVADKRLIYADQDCNMFTVCNRDQDWGRSFASETRGKVLWYSETETGLPGAWLEPAEGAPARGRRGYFAFPEDRAGAPANPEEILPSELLVQGIHQRKNLLAAACALRAMGVDPEAIRGGMASFPGVEHRMEFFAESAGVRWYNDSAATIPQAVAAALLSFDGPPVLITGGTDKNLDFEPVRKEYARAKSIILLAGTGTEKLRTLLDEDGLRYRGPFADLDAAVESAANDARPGDSVILSPGCTSFGMFLHEFDRGRKFKESALRAMRMRESANQKMPI